MLTKSDFEHIKQLIDDSRKQLKDDILDFKSEILGEIQSLREDVMIVIGYKDQIEDHELRIQKLEQAPNP